MGGTAGLLVGLTALAFPPSGIVVGGGLVLLISLWGASVGGMLTGMAGAAYSSSRLKKFESAIDWTAKMKNLAREVSQLPTGPAWLDGEAVVLNAKGVPDLQEA